MNCRFLLATLFLFNSLSSLAECKEGTKLILSFDQKNQVFSVKKALKSEVCHWITNQLNSNTNVKYFNNGKLVFEHSLLFPLITIHEEVSGGNKMRPHARKESFQKIINIPVEIKSLESFKVFDLMSNKILSEGNIQ
jgi:hypothetical protein